MACQHTQSETCSLCAQTIDAKVGPGGASTGRLLPAGTTIGRYVVRELIGSGGMGDVYTAHDPHLDRVVAVKVLRSTEYGRSPVARTRLIREAQAMAQLAHPNVVPVYDSGPFEQGLFIAMELVNGSTADLWLREGSRSWRDILRLFIQAGRGLEAAHARGLIHRDFKPANVLVGEDGRARVTDFGLVRTVDSVDELPSDHEVSPPASFDEQLTEAGMTMGSPGYMAPEQHAGEETTAATDQFAFCVSLYEALYGRRPFKAPNPDERHALATSGVVPPPPRGTDVPAWVFDIIARGLSLKPQDRHPSMGAVLAALEADPGLKRRRRWQAAAVVAVLAASLGTAAWRDAARSRACQGADALLAGVWDEALQARAEASFQATGLPYALPTWSVARQALDGWAQQWVSARVEACEATRLRGEQSERQLVLRFACLDRRLAEFGALARALTTADEGVVSSAAGAASRLTPIASCANLKQLEDRRAPPPELAEAARSLAGALDDARARIVAGRSAEARAPLEAGAGRAAELGLVALESEAHEALVDVELEAGQPRAARARAERALHAAETAADDVSAARILARLVSIIGWRLGQVDEARSWASLALAIAARLGNEPLTVARIQEGLGDTDWQAGQRASALAAYRRSLALFLEAGLAGSLDEARLRSSVGWVLTEQGLLDEAREEIERSRILREQLLSAGHPRLMESWNELGHIAGERRDFQEVLRCAKEGMRIATGASPSRVVKAHVALVASLVLAGRLEEAAAELERARPGVLELAESHPARVLFTRMEIVLLARRGQAPQALERAKALLALREGQLGPQHPEIAGPSSTVGEVAFALGQWAQAVEAFSRVVALWDAKGGRDTPSRGEVLLQLAQAHLALGQVSQARPLAERALVALEAGVRDLALFGEARRTVAEALLRQGVEGPRAAELLERARTEALEARDEALEARIARLRR